MPPAESIASEILDPSGSFTIPGEFTWPVIWTIISSLELEEGWRLDESEEISFGEVEVSFSNIFCPSSKSE